MRAVACAVHPLGDEAAAELIRAERGDRSAPPAAGQDDQRRERRATRSTSASWSARSDPMTSWMHYPDSLDALLTARLDQLPPDDRHLVCRASVLGQRFARDLLPVVLDEGSAAVTPRRLRRGSATSWRPFPASGSGFGHALIRDAAYQLLPYRTRRKLHGRVAEHLTASGQAEPGVLSYHYFAAQQWPEAWQSARSAADAALASHAPVEAAELSRPGPAVRPSNDDLPASALLATGLELSRAYERSSRYDAAERTYRRLGRLATDPA